MERKQKDVIRDMFQEALRRDPERKRPWTVIVDGGEKQLELILGFARQYRPQASLILDFIYVLEYLLKAAYGFHAVGSVEAENWVAERALSLLQGNTDGVIQGLCQSAALHQLSSDKRKALDKCAGYLEKYSPMLRYHEYLAEGLPIATGVIEGTCRHLIKGRMDRTGARWRMKGAEAVLEDGLQGAFLVAARQPDQLASVARADEAELQVAQGLAAQSLHQTDAPAYPALVPPQKGCDLHLAQIVLAMKRAHDQGLFELADRPGFPVELKDGRLHGTLAQAKHLGLDGADAQLAAGPKSLEAIDEFIALCRVHHNDGKDLPELTHGLEYQPFGTRMSETETGIALPHCANRDIHD